MEHVDDFPSKTKKILFPVLALAVNVSTSSEAFVFLLALLLAAGNGIGLPLLPVLFARSIANFSILYNPSLSEITGGLNSKELDENEVTKDIQKTSRIIIGFGIAAAISTFMMSYVQIKIARAIVGRIRRKLFSCLIRQDASWYNLQKVGDLSTRITKIDSVERVLGQTAMEIIRDLFAFIGGFTFAFTNSWRMSLVVLSFMPIIALIGAIMTVLLNRETRKYQNSLGTSNDIAHEAFSLIRTVFAYNGKEHEKTRYQIAIDEVSQNQMRRSVASAFGTGLLMLVIMSCFSAGFWFGSRFVRDGIVSLSGAIAASSIVPAVFAAFRLANGQKLVGAASAAARSVLEIMHSRPVLDPLSSSGIIPKDFKGGISFEGVSFSYDTSRKYQNDDISKHENYKSSLLDPHPRNVLSNVTLRVDPGSSHALCGPSGSGKSTFFALITRQYDVSTGRILLDGKHDIRDVNIRWLRSQIGHVGQIPTLFQGTIRQNIEYGVHRQSRYQENEKILSSDRGRVRMEEIVRVAKLANAHEFIQSLPEGYETTIGEGGTSLSGGQKQRLCIARALIRKPKVLLLDECTASLDNENTAIVQDALDKAAKNCTTITIAHNLSSVRYNDMISIVGGKKILQQGTHDELMDQASGFYYETVKLQRNTQEEVNFNTVALPSNENQNFKFQTSVEKNSNAENSSERLLRMSSSDYPLTKKFYHRERTGISNVSTRILSMQKPERIYVFLGAVGSAVSGASWPLAAACISELLHVGPTTGGSAEVRKWLLLLLGCGIAAFLGILIQNILLDLVGERLTKRARQRYFDIILSQDMAFFDRTENSAGSLTLKLSSQTALLRALTTDTVGFLTLAVASVTTGSVIALYYCWRIALIGFVFMPGILLSGFSLFQAGLDYGKDEAVESVRLASEAIHCISTVASLGIEEVLLGRYEETIQRYSSTERPGIILASGLGAYIAASPYMLFGSSFLVGSIILENGYCTLLGMNKAILCVFLGSVLVGEISHTLPERKKAFRAASDFFSLLDASKSLISVQAACEHAEVDSFTGKLEVRNLSFKYPNAPGVQILNGFTLEIDEGKTLALVGPSGSGKSTILNLIERFYHLEKGFIYFNGKDICDFELSSLRGKIGFVQQESEIFNRTIRENIVYGLDEAAQKSISQLEVESAARTAQAHEFIDSLPNGYETLAGPRGNRLSGGQRQRISIARALVRRPSLLLLDEATSALDSHTSGIVQEALKGASNGRTTIIVAHNLTTIRDVDIISYVYKGTVLEEGTHEDLMQRQGRYARLYQANS